MSGFDDQLEQAALDLDQLLEQKGVEIQTQLDQILIQKENFDFETWPDIQSTLENITSFVNDIEAEFNTKIIIIEEQRQFSKKNNES